MSNKYSAYFDIDEHYFPQVNESSILAAAPDFWKFTYPHETFVTMLTVMERLLARQEMRSLWVEGAYGTGKSQCVYALKQILEAPEEDVRDYWRRYDGLQKNPDLLEKLIGHRRSGILTAYRYASGSINSPRDLFLAVQDSIKASLDKAGLYSGENTLKESVIAWIEQTPANKNYLNSLLQEPKWAASFAESTADEILTALKKGREVKTLMDNLFHLAGEVGITALNIDADRLIAWITDIIDRNDIRIVFIWDEFSDYFKNNRNSLSEFQKLAELVNAKPFYLVVVTHESGQLFTTSDNTWIKIRDRYHRVQITLPDHIAFELIGHALKVKEAAREDWTRLADTLNSRVDTVRPKVMEAAKVKDPQVMRKIMPLHPMAALLLKNIAAAFKSNQRSMFDFIKTSGTEDVQAFQWYIAENGPISNHPLLTVDLLWDFFYEKGKDNLSSDIRLILDTFPQQQNLREDEKCVLKAILIMQAIDQRLGGAIDLFKPTDQHLSYVFEGMPNLENTQSGHIAHGLKEKGILVARPISNNRSAYAAAVLAGDQVKIDQFKEEVRRSSTTAKLVTEGVLSTVLALPPALRLRFETEPGSGKITTVTTADFTKTINTLRDKESGWKFHAVLALAKDDMEVVALRQYIKKAVTDEQYQNIVFIDALSTPLGVEAFDLYVEYAALSMYYQSNNRQASAENAAKAKQVLELDWKNRIYNSPCIVQEYKNQEGMKVANAVGVAAELQVIVKRRFPLVFDFSRGLTEAQLKLSQPKPSAKAGITQKTSGVVSGIEKHVLPTVWNQQGYWNNPNLAAEPIVKIKSALNQCIQEAFRQEGRIAVGSVCAFLEEQYGFAPCNLSAFLAGFLLKEYGSDPYRASDSNGAHEPMTPEKLAGMLADCISKRERRPTAIVRMTPEERAFYQMTETAWDLPANACVSADQAAREITGKLRDLKLPAWCLENADGTDCFDIVQKYLDLVQSNDSRETHKTALELGRIAAARPGLGETLRDLLTGEKCREGMLAFLQGFEDGRVLRLAEEIGAKETLLDDIRKFFDVKHACLWNRETGENEIRKLLTEYGFVKESNAILNTSAQSYSAACMAWYERLHFFHISSETLAVKHPQLTKICSLLLKLHQKADLLPEQKQVLYEELKCCSSTLKDALINDSALFAQTYAPYLEDLEENDVAAVKSGVPNGLFACSVTECNATVKAVAEEYRKNQIKTQLFRLWQDKTGTKNPLDWSRRYQTPILCCVSKSEYGKAKSVFELLNRNWGTAEQIKEGLAFLETTGLFTDLQDADKRDDALLRGIVGSYRVLLPIGQVRDKLGKLNIDVYDWPGNPQVQDRLCELAEAEYNAGGSDKALRKIDAMDDALLKQYLKKLVHANMRVGIEILSDDDGAGGERQDA